MKEKKKHFDVLRLLLCMVSFLLQKTSTNVHCFLSSKLLLLTYKIKSANEDEDKKEGEQDERLLSTEQLFKNSKSKQPPIKIH